MNGFLVINQNTQQVSEWLNSIQDFLEELDKLEKVGQVSNIKVQQFKEHKLSVEVVYDYDGQMWQKRN